MSRDTYNSCDLRFPLWFDRRESNIQVIAVACLASLEHPSVSAPARYVFAGRLFLLGFCGEILECCRQTTTAACHLDLEKKVNITHNSFSANLLTPLMRIIIFYFLFYCFILLLIVFTILSQRLQENGHNGL